MASRSDAAKQLQRLLDREVLDIHGVAELLGMQRSSVNTLLVRDGSSFPERFTSYGVKIVTHYVYGGVRMLKLG